MGYGVLMMDDNKMISRTDMSFYEVFSGEMAGLSIVFHCATGGARAFCAPFLMGDDDGKTIFANFQAALTTESQITMFPNGDVSVELDTTDVYVNTLGCDSLAYGIFYPGTDALTESSVDCATVVGNAYDPTNSCVDFSGSEYCTNGVLCNGNNDSGYSYNFDFAADRYSCAPGDLSGKLGMISDPSATALSVEHEGDNSLIPYTDDLIGKVMAIYCPYADSSSPVYLACAPIEEQTNDPSGVERLSFVMACIVSLIALLQ